MNVQYCKNEHIFTNQHGGDLCPSCGKPLTERELPDVIGEPAGTEEKTVNEPLSVLIAAALVTPQGQHLVRKLLERIDDKFFH